jgi:hypothetical protein
MTESAPTAAERLQKLVDVFEVATTDGELHLNGDQIGDVYLWLQWVQDRTKLINERMAWAQQRDDAELYNILNSILKGEATK